MGDQSAELQAYVQAALRQAAPTPQPQRREEVPVEGATDMQQQPARVELAEVEAMDNSVLCSVLDALCPVSSQFRYAPTKQRSCCLWTTLRSATTGRAFDINSHRGLLWGFGVRRRD